MMPYKQFLNYIQFVGLLKVTFKELHDICELMEVIYTIGKEKYIHYDHFLIVLRECVMPRVELKKKKELEKGDPQPPHIIELQKYTQKKQLLDLRVKKNKKLNCRMLLKNEQINQLELKLKNESIQIYPLNHLPGAQVGTLNLNQQRKVNFIFSNDSQINEIKTDINSLLLGEQSEITLSHELELGEMKNCQIQYQ